MYWLTASICRHRSEASEVGHTDYEDKTLEFEMVTTEAHVKQDIVLRHAMKELIVKSRAHINHNTLNTIM